MTIKSEKFPHGTELEYGIKLDKAYHGENLPPMRSLNKVKPLLESPAKSMISSKAGAPIKKKQYLNSLSHMVAGTV